MKGIDDSLMELFLEHGQGLYSDPLRLEAFLRDLHWDKPKEVTVIMEILYSGAVEQILLGMKKRELLDFLEKRTALSPSMSQYALRIWHRLVQENILDIGQTESRLSNSRLGTVDEVLGAIQKESKKWKQ